MLWVRNFNSNQSVLGRRLLIHGHTPAALENILIQNGNCINIDGGCVYSEKIHLGRLVAFNVKDGKFISVSNCE